MKFFCDHMLGTLAKWLRIYGFDTLYANADLDDIGILEIAKSENRVIITRDKNMIIRARRDNINNISILSTNINKQIKTVFQKIEYDKEKILSRCIICNLLVQNIDKKDVKEKVPNRVFENNNEFWICPKCKKIYWKGTHYENMVKKIKGLS